MHAGPRPGTAVLYLAVAAVLVAAVVAVGGLDTLRERISGDHESGGSEEARAVVRVIDGDTLEVAGPSPDSKNERVRVLGINTPEISHSRGENDQCGGPEAAQRLADALPKGSAVRLVADSRADDHDRYDRALRYIETSDGTDVGAQLIHDGYAYPWKPSSAPAPDRYTDYQDAAHDAHASRDGSWATCPTFDHSK